MTVRGNLKVERSSLPAPAAQDDEERRLRDFAEAASDWFWEIDRELRFVYMSDGTNAPSSAFARDFLGKRITEVHWSGLDQISAISYKTAEEVARVDVGDHPQRMRTGVVPAGWPGPGA